MSKYRIGLAAFYFTLFDDVMPATFRAEREQMAQTYQSMLERHFDVVYPGLILDDKSGAKASEVFREEAVDVVLFAPVMAAPPSYGAEVVKILDLPIVIWNVPTVHTLPNNLHQDEATGHTTMVGSIMLGNVLLRAGKQFEVVTAAVDNSEQFDKLIRVLKGVSVAHRLSTSRLARIGGIIPGYLDIEVDNGIFKSGIGADILDMQAAELNAAMETVTQKEIDHAKEAMQTEYQLKPEISDDILNQSVKLAIALETLVMEHGISAGAVNCHGDCFRNNDQVGIVACLGISRLSALGIPFACTGDVLTATALWIGQELAGAALYCECYAIEQDTGLMLLAAGGEGDPRMSDDGRAVQLELNHHYPGCHGCGVSITYPVRKGPATLISLSPYKPSPSGWRLVWATGRIVETRFEQMGGPNAMFQFENTDLVNVSEKWIASGATHHNALIPGIVDTELMSLTKTLGIDTLRI